MIKKEFLIGEKTIQISTFNYVRLEKYLIKHHGNVFSEEMISNQVESLIDMFFIMMKEEEKDGDD